MSAKEYREAYSLLSDTEKNMMADLYMSGVNHDGHTWVTYGQVEKIVGTLILNRKGIENDNERKT